MKHRYIVTEIENETSVVYGYQFKTSLINVFITSLLLITFISLGIWQLNRAKEKQELRDEFLARTKLPQVTVEEELLDVDSKEFRRARATGRYLAEYQILLDNNIYRGQAGYHVLTPLLLMNSTTILLVNRGWIPWGPDRKQIPTVEAPDQRVIVNGRLVKPKKHAFSFERQTSGEGFQKVWQNLDLQKFESLTGYPVQQLVMLLHSGNENESIEFVRDWPQYQDTWIQRHRGYAVQWFALALVLVCIFFFLSFKSRT